ncbi:MAG TPA: FecR domain-containing protein [Polyangiaceae bacterium]
MSTSSEEVGERFGTALGEGPSRATLAAQRVLVMEMAQRSFRERPRPSAWTYALLFVPVAALATAFAVFSTRPRALEAHFQGVALAVDARLRASERSSDALDFSDGSQVVLERNARATLSALSSEHAALRLERGRVSASIRKQPGMTWAVMAGPYAVHVVGTKFSVDWDAGDEALAVRVREGRVRVTGGDLPSGGLVVDAGGQLERRRSTPPSASTAVAPAPGGRAPFDSPRETKGAENERTVDDAPAANGSATVSALSSKGKYKEALALAEKQGFARLTRELPENDLLLLANAARYSGDAARAREALTKLRERFAGRPGASLAALYLAKVAEDMTREPGEAIRWLRVYLRDSPRGDLASGARASLMSLLLRSGDRAGARSVAEDYLRLHPNGSHAAEARALVSE